MMTLADHRAKARLSQEGAARRCDVSVTTWRNWEAGRATPLIPTYPRIAKALGITIEQVQDAVRLIETDMLRRAGAA